jgi:hypothetical protein
VTLFKRLFSSDFRAAVAAEAAGDLDLAAERYALAGEREAAVRVHMARANRADSRAEEIRALRDALHWATDEVPSYAAVRAALGFALLARAREQGVATERDRDRVREAAELLNEAGEYEAAGDALESIEDDRAAARAFERGGFVVRMESAMARDSDRADTKRALANAFSEYEMRLGGGERVSARDALRQCVEVAQKKREYRKLLDDLEGRMISGGRVALRRRGKPMTVIAAGDKIVLGRDALCDLVLRSGGISRMHTEIEIGFGEDGARVFALRDLSSRNGTLIAGMPVAGSVPLAGNGTFSLGDDCDIDFDVTGDPPVLTLEVRSGLDRGVTLRAAGAGLRMPITDVPAVVRFVNGRPHLSTHPPERSMRLNGKPIARGEVQLIHGDALSFDGVEVEVL